MSKSSASAREEVLAAALKQFAAKGYAGTSMRDVIASTRFTLPTIYYHFGNKAGIYKALVDAAFDEAYGRMQAAAARHAQLESQLVEIAVAMFDLVRQRRELTRLAFATAFAAPEELPPEVRDARKRQRNLRFITDLLGAARGGGELNRRYDRRELAEGYYAVITFQVMRRLLDPGPTPTRRQVARMVRLFLEGAGVGDLPRTLV